MSLPDGYVGLIYIQSDGAQYIDTGFKPNQDTRLDMQAIVMDSSDAASAQGFIPYGAGTAYNSNAFESYGQNGQYEFNYDGQYDYLATLTKGDNVSISHNKNSITLKVNGTTYTKTFTYETFTTPYNLTLFAIQRSSIVCGKLKLYACQIYDNGTLVRNFIPCKNDSGTIGLWDDVNGVFYTNAGTGVFTAGEQVTESHAALINGVAYGVVGGRTLINGTAYTIKQGTALIDGTKRTISFAEDITITLIKKSTYTVGTGGTATLEYNGMEYNLVGSGTETLVIKEGTTVTVKAGGCTNGTNHINGKIKRNNTAVGTLDGTGNRTYTFSPQDGDTITGDRIYVYQESSLKGGVGSITVPR